MRTKAKINKQNTRHGKMDMPFAALNKYAGMAKGGDVKKEMKAAGIFAKAGEKELAAHERREAMGKEKDTPAIAKKEMSVLKKAKAPKDVMDYEKDEHKAMGFARGGGIESKGKTRGKFFAEGGDVENNERKSKLDRDLLMARARGGQPDYTNRDVRKGTAQAGMAALSMLPAGRVAGIVRKASAADKAMLGGASLLGSLQTAGDMVAQKEKEEQAESKNSSKTNAKKYARGGGVESKGKTRGKFI